MSHLALLIRNYILFERNCIRKEQSVGGNVENSMWHRLYNNKAYASFLSDTFSLQEDIGKQDLFRNSSCSFIACKPNPKFL